MVFDSIGPITGLDTAVRFCVAAADVQRPLDYDRTKEGGIMGGSLSPQGAYSPSTSISLKLPDGQIVELGYVEAVPPEGADAEYEGKSYKVKHVLWKFDRYEPGDDIKKRVHAIVTLKDA